MRNDSAAFAFEARLDARGFDLALTVAPGETVAVLGPNGAGKSTLLALIAGLFEPDQGRARLGDQVLFDVGGDREAPGRPSGRGPAEQSRPGGWSLAEQSRPGGWSLAAMLNRGRPDVFVRPHARSVALLAQEPLLFPHLSVLDNVAFAPRSAGKSSREARALALDWLDEVDAREFAARKPHQLSGGQAQRIAVARALAAEPALLLLDEPLSALDIEVAPAIRMMLRRVLKGRSALIVTHDVLDAYELADRVVVVDGGRVVESGPTRRVLEHPRSAFARRLLAANVVAGSANGRASTGAARRPGAFASAGFRGTGETLATATAAAAAAGAGSSSVRASREARRVRLLARRRTTPDR